MSSSRDESTEKEPVMCSKCNEVFETADSKYIQHYNEEHKAEADLMICTIVQSKDVSIEIKYP